MANEEGYQGWTNYQTWAISLWIDNEESLYRESRRVVRAMIDDACEAWSEYPAHDWRRAIQTREQYITHEVADALQEWFGELEPTEEQSNMTSGVFSDLLNHALAHVEWREIAENWISEEEIPAEETEDAAEAR